MTQTHYLIIFFTLPWASFSFMLLVPFPMLLIVPWHSTSIMTSMDTWKNDPWHKLLTMTLMTTHVTQTCQQLIHCLVRATMLKTRICCSKRFLDYVLAFGSFSRFLHLIFWCGEFRVVLFHFSHCIASHLLPDRGRRYYIYWFSISRRWQYELIGVSSTFSVEQRSSVFVGHYGDVPYKV